MSEITKQRLKNYVYVRREVENQLERLARMKNEEQIPAIRPGDGSKKNKGGGDRLERAIIRRLEYEEQALPQIEAAQEEMETVRAAIDSLEDPLEREVLRLRYIDGEYCRMMPWREVAVIIYGSDDEKYIQATFRLHGRALKRITGRA